MNWTIYRDAAELSARKAGEMLLENMESHRTISHKGAIDLVTNFDSSSQDIILKLLSGQFKEHDFLAEEGLSRKQGSDFRWIFDPIDGTTNYAHRFPVFCVSIALEYKKDIVLGVVYDPMREELFSAVKGKGSTLNGKKIKVSDIDELDKAMLSTGFPYDVRSSKLNNINHFVRFLKKSQAIRRCGSAAIDLCYVACGRFDGFWELKLNSWDVAAASLILKESGGEVSLFSGETLDIFKQEILGSNRLIHQEMIDILQLQ